MKKFFFNFKQCSLKVNMRIIDWQTFSAISSLYGMNETSEWTPIMNESETICGSSVVSHVFYKKVKADTHPTVQTFQDLLCQKFTTCNPFPKTALKPPQWLMRV